MDESDPIEARTERLHALKDDDPVAWAICYGHRGLLTLSTFLEWPEDQVQNELNRLVKAKAVKRVKFHRGYSYMPESLEMKRLAKRAWKLKREQK